MKTLIWKRQVYVIIKETLHYSKYRSIYEKHLSIESIGYKKGQNIKRQVMILLQEQLGLDCRTLKKQKNKIFS